MKHAVLGAIAVSIAAVCASAQAQAPVQVIAYTSRSVNLRAGPARDYPVVAVLPGGFQVAVQGCLSDYTWCDVIAGYDRGWVYAGNIVYPYQGANVPVLTYGSAIGIGIITFGVISYWDSYYIGRPWYAQRHVWINHPPPLLRSRVHRAPIHGPAVAPGDRRPPPRAPDLTPRSSHPRPKPQPPGAGTQPPQRQAPGGFQRPPQGQAPGAGPRPPQHQAPGGFQRPPQGQAPGAGQPAPRPAEPGHGQPRPQTDHRPGGR